MKQGLWIATSLVAASLITGCGSSEVDGDNGIVPPVLSGTVAIGAPLAAELSIRGSHGCVVTLSTDANGHYRTSEIVNITAPYIIRATTEDGIALFSYSDGQTKNSVANVTPMTSYAVDYAAEQIGVDNASYLFGSFAINNDISDEIDDGVVTLNAVVGDAMEREGVPNFNHFETEFVADHTGYDKFLDEMDIEVFSDNVVIREGGQVLDTLPSDINGTVTVTGFVTNALLDANATDANLTDVRLSFTNANTTEVVEMSTNGNFSAVLDPARSYDINITKNGYISQSYTNLSTFELADFTMQSISLIPDSVSGPGTLNGSVINARTAAGLGGVTLEFRAGLNHKTGDVVATATTSEDGNYSIGTVATGVYTVAYSSEGYTTRYISATVLSGETTTLNTQLISAPELGCATGAGALATVILEWGENPRDPDSHVSGDNPDGSGRFHIYYANKRMTTPEFDAAGFNVEEPCSSEGVVASLDLDDTSSFGPETTTICRGYGGIFKYYIRHFAGTGTISDSPTNVTVTTMSGITQTWTAPADPSNVGVGNIWHVFNVDEFGNIFPINQFLGAQPDNITLSPARNNDERELFEYLPAK